MRILLGFCTLLGLSSVAAADWLVLASGERTEVASVEIGPKAVRVTTLNGKTWLIPRDAVDVERTVAANPKPPPPQTPPPPTPPTRPATPPPPPPRAPAPPSPPPRPAPEPPPEPAPAPRSVAAPPIAPSPPPSPSPTIGHRVAIFVNGAVTPTETTFGESRTYQLFRETATLETTYADTRTHGLELGGFVRLKGPLGFGASAELFDRSPTASYASSVPHPFFYERLRQSSGIRADLTGRERAFHFDPVLSFVLGSRVSVDVFSGPSLFFIETDVLEDVSYEEQFPFDEIVETGTTLRRVEQSPWGFNVGASTTFRVGGIFGVDFGVRYSRAIVRVVPVEGSELVFDAGGLRLGAGVRFLIP